MPVSPRVFPMLSSSSSRIPGFCIKVFRLLWIDFFLQDENFSSVRSYSCGYPASKHRPRRQPFPNARFWHFHQKLVTSKTFLNTIQEGFQVSLKIGVLNTYCDFYSTVKRCLVWHISWAYVTNANVNKSLFIPHREIGIPPKSDVLSQSLSELFAGVWVRVTYIGTWGLWHC